MRKYQLLSAVFLANVVSTDLPVARHMTRSQRAGLMVLPTILVQGTCELRLETVHDI